MNKDEQFIKEFYHSQDADKPSNELDARVLALARENMPIKSHWRKWQWPASIAASVMFVSVILFTQYTNFTPNVEDRVLWPKDKVDPFVLAQKATLDTQQLELAKRQRRQQEAEILANRNAQEQQAIADMQRLSGLGSTEVLVSSAETSSQPELANYAQKEVATLAARALDNIELDILPLELEESSAIDTGLKKETMESPLADGQMTSLAQPKTAEQQPKQMVNSDYLDELHANFVVIKSQIDKLTEQDTIEFKQLNVKLMEIQTTAFDYLKLLKLAEPNLKIQSRYFEILSEKQQKLLVPEQINE